ncbi:MAG: phospholipid carrier-dependent glycosyltransferase [Actinomycetota bacterium]|nr:phospholipid carrier-dependent glycosyltransferase [Actinomycetota bacterium]
MVSILTLLLAIGSSAIKPISTSAVTTRGKAEEQAAGEGAGGARALAWERRDTLLIIVLVMIAALLRFVRLSHPDTLVFDETYYAKDACLYAGYSPDFCGLNQPTEQSYVHPPLGKWLIAAGVEVFGYNSFGWRFAAAVFGTALIVVVFLLSRELFRNRWTAGAAGLLVATDFLLIVESRIAMLDIFLAFFVVLGFLFLALNRSVLLRMRRSPQPEGSGRESPEGTFLLNACGACMGLALATKWSAIFALLAAIGLALAWEVGIWRARGAKKASLAPPVARVAFALIVVPGLFYVASYAPYVAERLDQPCAFEVPERAAERLFGEGFLGLGEGECVRGAQGAALSFADLHERMTEYHFTLDAKHSYQSKAWTWPLVLRPVSYYFTHERQPNDEASEIIAIGNIAVWYGALLAAAWLLVTGRRRWEPQRVVVAAWAAQYLPWLLVSRPLFFFYMTPVVPFMMIGLAAALSAWRRNGRVAHRVVTLYLVLGVGGMLLLFYPVLTAIPIPYERWLNLMWYGIFQCGPYRCGWI